MIRPIIKPIIATGVAKTNPNRIATKIPGMPAEVVKVRINPNPVNAQKTTNVAHLVLASLNLPVCLSNLYINLALIESSGGAG